MPSDLVAELVSAGAQPRGRAPAWLRRGQQAGIFRKLAEDNPVEKMCHLCGIKTSLTHGFSDFRDTFRRVLGHRNTGATGSQGLGVMKYRPEHLDTAGITQSIEGYFMGGGYRAGKVGVNDNPVQIAQHQ